jgi:hypothetical protein
MAAGGSAVEVNAYNVDGGFRLPNRDPKQAVASLLNSLKATFDRVVSGVGFGMHGVPGRPLDPVESQVSFRDAQ